jgi:hypothetical protein
MAETVMIVEAGRARLYVATWRGLRDALPVRADGTVCDLLCVDGPYSAETQSGHDGGMQQVNAKPKANGVNDTGRPRRTIHYDPWTPDIVDAFVDAWLPVTRGWFVSLTDDVLAPSWRAAYRRHGRLAFHSIPCIERGMSVRLCGGGPSSWAVYAMTCRPRNAEFASGPTTDGAYVGPSEKKPWIGGKAEWLMGRIVSDFSRRDDLVVDPCVGGGTSGVMSVRLGRQFIGGDEDPAAIEESARRIGNAREQTVVPLGEARPMTTTKMTLGE